MVVVVSLQSAASAVPRPEVPDSTGDIDVLQAIKTENWERLGGLLAVRDPVLGAIISAWPSLTLRQRDALAALARP